jgi:AhpD family alkylhydroperoxidase
MPRIEPLADDNAAPAEVRELLYWSNAEGSPDPRMARIMARTDAGAAMLRVWRTVFFGGHLPLRLKELVRIRFVATEECGYCSSLKTQRARDEGVTPEVLLDLASYESSSLIDEREKAALRFTDLWRQDAIANDEAFDALRLQFTDEEIIELGALLSLCEGSRFAKALDVLSWADACAIDPTLQQHSLEPAAV